MKIILVTSKKKTKRKKYGTNKLFLYDVFYVNNKKKFKGKN